jgi:hypothetical protein
MTIREEAIQKIIINILQMSITAKAFTMTDYPSVWAWVSEAVTEAYDEIEAITVPPAEVDNQAVSDLALSRLRTYATGIIAGWN